jgi:hypothetical protein
MTGTRTRTTNDMREDENIIHRRQMQRKSPVYMSVVTASPSHPFYMGFGNWARYWSALPTT